MSASDAIIATADARSIGRPESACDLILAALIAYITQASTTPLDRQRRLRAAAQAMLAEIHDPEITQV